MFAKRFGSSGSNNSNNSSPADPLRVLAVLDRSECRSTCRLARRSVSLAGTTTSRCKKLQKVEKLQKVANNCKAFLAHTAEKTLLAAVKRSFSFRNACRFTCSESNIV